MHARYGAITLCGGFFQNLLLCIYLPHRSPTTPSRTRDGLASSAFARHYLRNHCCFLFLPLIRCFSSGGWQLMFTDLQSVGFPHSDTPASTVVCTSPGIFAAYHVLRRLQEPRHPPCALSHFHLFVQRQILGNQYFLDHLLLFIQVFLNDLYYYILPTLSMNFCFLHPATTKSQ